MPGCRGGAGPPTRVMLDCGFGIRETERRLARLGMLPGDIDGIVVTHEHCDHVGGVFDSRRARDRRSSSPTAPVAMKAERE